MTGFYKIRCSGGSTGSDTKSGGRGLAPPKSWTSTAHIRITQSTLNLQRARKFHSERAKSTRSGKWPNERTPRFTPDRRRERPWVRHRRQRVRGALFADRQAIYGHCDGGRRTTVALQCCRLNHQSNDRIQRQWRQQHSCSSGDGVLSAYNRLSPSLKHCAEITHTVLYIPTYYTIQTIADTTFRSLLSIKYR